MSKQVTPLFVEDVSAFSRALTKHLSQNTQALTHVRMLNLLAKAGGFRNFQHMKSAQKSEARLSNSARVGAVDYALVDRGLNQFDDAGRLIRWPARNKVQQVCIWVLWSKLPAGQILTEREVSDILNSQHEFADPATLRRVMVGYNMLQRNKDGSEYLRVEQKPPAEAVALIGALKSRSG